MALDLAASQKVKDNRKLPIHLLSDEDAAERILIDKQLAYADKEKDFARNERYKRIYQNLDDPNLALKPQSGDPAEDPRLYSNTRLPIEAGLVDGSLSKIFGTLFSTEDYFGIQADQWQDMLLAPKIAAHMKKQHADIKFRVTVYEILQQMHVFDYCASFFYWNVEPGFIDKEKQGPEVRVGGVGTGLHEREFDEVWVPDAIDRPEFGFIPYDRCAHDPAVSRSLDLNGSSFFIDWRHLSIEHLWSLSQTEEQPWGKYRNIDKVLAGHLSQRQVGLMPKSYERFAHKWFYDRILVDRYWTKHEVLEYANGYIISRRKTKGWEPQMWGIYRVPGSFRCMGMVERLERPGMDINNIVNTRRNIQNFMADPIGIIDKEMLADGDSGEVFPGRVYLPEGVDDVRKKAAFVYPQAPTDDGSREIALQMETMEKSAQVADADMGQTAGGRTSATAVVEAKRGSLSGTTMLSILLEFNSLTPAYQHQYRLNRKLLSVEEAFQTMGPAGLDFLRVGPRDYRASRLTNFQCRGATYSQYRAEKLTGIMRGLELAQLYPQGHNFQNIYAELWRLLAPLDSHKFVSDPRAKSENIPPEIENMMMAKGMRPQISPDNDHRKHFQAHEAIERTADYRIWPQWMKDNQAAHKQEHQQSMEAMAAVRRNMTINPNSAQPRLDQPQRVA